MQAAAISLCSQWSKGLCCIWWVFMVYILGLPASNYFNKPNPFKKCMLSTGRLLVFFLTIQIFGIFQKDLFLVIAMHQCMTWQHTEINMGLFSFYLSGALLFENPKSITRMLLSDQKKKKFLFLFFAQYQGIACWHPNTFSKWSRSSLTSVKVLGVHLANRITWKVTPRSDNMNIHEQADKNWDCSLLLPTPKQWYVEWHSHIYQLRQSLAIWVRHDVYSLQQFV